MEYESKEIGRDKVLVSFNYFDVMREIFRFKVTIYRRVIKTRAKKACLLFGASEGWQNMHVLPSMIN